MSCRLSSRRPALWWAILIAVGCTTSGGCHRLDVRNRVLETQVRPELGIPAELSKVSLPVYRIEAPDILLVDAVKIIPKAPYKIEPYDILQIVASDSLPDQPIAGSFTVDVGGVVNLGPSYGSVQIAGHTLDEAAKIIRGQLAKILQEPDVSVVLAQGAGKQQVAGEHAVGPDGTISLGTYGEVLVAGMTTDEARLAIEEHLAQFLETPEVSVDIISYNSKVYYVITEGAGNGDLIAKFPVTGNETVLDAVSAINGLSRVSSKNIWVARPRPDCGGPDQILPVNWAAIAKGGATKTNYQLMPGDRVFIAEDKMYAFDGWVQKVTSPFERLFGFTLLGTQTVQAINRFPNGANPNNF